MNTTAYSKLIKENGTKRYKKSSGKVVEKLNAQSAKIAENLELGNRIEKLGEKEEAFLTLKDHKPALHDHLPCRLINPSKSTISVISKHILDDINTTFTNKTKINQWKNTSGVLKRFNGLQPKESLSFICFDVCDFYPTITEKLLHKALDFANSYRPISEHERDIIIHAKRSLLFSINIPWEKKTSNNRFNVTMGSFDGTETCELVGCYILSLLTEKYGNSIGLYCDDGLSSFNKTPQKIEKCKKDICKILRDNDLKITVEANLTKVNFLDLTLNLKSRKHLPYTKEGNTLLYVLKQSNIPLLF